MYIVYVYDNMIFTHFLLNPSILLFQIRISLGNGLWENTLTGLPLPVLHHARVYHFSTFSDILYFLDYVKNKRGILVL